MRCFCSALCFPFSRLELHGTRFPKGSFWTCRRGTRTAATKLDNFVLHLSCTTSCHRESEVTESRPPQQRTVTGNSPGSQHAPRFSHSTPGSLQTCIEGPACHLRAICRNSEGCNPKESKDSWALKLSSAHLQDPAVATARPGNVRKIEKYPKCSDKQSCMPERTQDDAGCVVLRDSGCCFGELGQSCCLRVCCRALIGVPEKLTMETSLISSHQLPNNSTRPSRLLVLLVLSYFPLRYPALPSILMAQDEAFSSHALVDAGFRNEA